MCKISIKHAKSMKIHVVSVLTKAIIYLKTATLCGQSKMTPYHKSSGEKEKMDPRTKDSDGKLYSLCSNHVYICPGY